MDSFLVVGLGNIGNEYAGTRHNVGFMVLDAWAQASNAVFSSKRYGDIAEITVKGRKFVLLKPSTYMNLSGNAVRFWLRKLNLPLERLVVISDDLNLPFGTVRMRRSGSSGGHNGLENITEMLGSDQWTRIRVGIGNEFQRGGQIDFVLGELTAEEKDEIRETGLRIAEGVQTFALAGPEIAMNSLNSKRKN